MANQRTWAQYCVPTALSYVLTDMGYGEISKEEAADLVRHHPANKRRRGWCNDRATMAVVKEYIPGAKIIRYFWDDGTLARWLKEDGRDAMVAAAHHTMVVKGGKVVEDNGYCPRRGRMNWAVILPKSTPEEVGE